MIGRHRAEIPNLITILRLFLAAAFFALLEVYRYPAGPLWAGNAALLFFILAAVTDALDGYLARRWNVISTFGRIMDPFCDKVLVLGAFIYLAGPRFTVASGGVHDQVSAVDPWMVVVILARELLVTGVRGVLESMGVRFGSLALGKAKMILQSIAIPIVMALVINFGANAGSWSRTIIEILVWITVIVSVASGWPYVTGLRRVLRTPSAEIPR